MSRASCISRNVLSAEYPDPAVNVIFTGRAPPPPCGSCHEDPVAVLVRTCPVVPGFSGMISATCCAAASASAADVAAAAACAPAVAAAACALSTSSSKTGTSVSLITVFSSIAARSTRRMKFAVPSFPPPLAVIWISQITSPATSAICCSSWMLAVFPSVSISYMNAVPSGFVPFMDAEAPSGISNATPPLYRSKASVLAVVSYWLTCTISGSPLGIRSILFVCVIIWAPPLFSK